MYLLYERFVEQAKQADIQRYNAKHRDYLIRAGKIKPDYNHQDNYKQQNQGQPARTRQREFRRENVQNRNREEQYLSQKIEIVEKPIRGSQGYNLDVTDEAEIFAKSKKQPTQAMHLNEQPSQLKKEKQRNVVPQQRAEQILYEQIKSEKLPQKIVVETREEQLQEHAEVELVECPENCGRKFNPRALQKHIKICQKGEKKRKVFKVKVVDEEAQKLKKDEPIAATKKDDVPKWKKDSEELRNRIQNKQVVDDRTECPGCGRKFEEQAASRHIPKCVQRAAIHRKK